MDLQSSFGNTVELRPLETKGDASVLAYLNTDPVRNLILMGFIKRLDTTESDEGTVYGYWRDSVLHGVGVLGHVAAWAGGLEVARALGEQARDASDARVKMIGGPHHEVEAFLVSSGERRRGETQRHKLCLLRRGELTSSGSSELSLRAAVRSDFDELFRIHEELFLELVRLPLPDPALSARRLMHRVEENRVWIARDGNKIVFKIDAATETDDAVLLEAVWTDPRLRGRGIGQALLSDFCSRLLSTYPSICLYLDDERPRLQEFYGRIGFKHQPDHDYTVVRFSRD